MARSKRNSVENITDADSEDDIALLANTPAKPESLLNSREQVTEYIGVHLNANKTEYTYFKWEGAISTLRFWN